MHLYCITVCKSCDFCINTFSYAMISAIVTIQIKIYWLHEYFVASAGATILKAPLGNLEIPIPLLKFSLYQYLLSYYNSG